MSQQHAKSNNEPNPNNLELSANSTSAAGGGGGGVAGGGDIINLDDSDDEVEFMFYSPPHPIPVIASPTTSTATTNPSDSLRAANKGEDAHMGMGGTIASTSTAAAAAAAAEAASDALKTANDPETADDDAAAAAGGDSASSSSAAALDCPICLQSCIHPARLPCGHIFCFLCVKGVAYKNRRCAMCRREIPAEFLDHPQLVNGIDDICATRGTEDGYQWYYEGRNGWWQYDDRTSQDIEEAFKKGEKSCTILVAGYVYIVDLEQMVQQRQNEPTRCRRVKRDLATIPKKGVAGLRIEGNQVTSDTVFSRPSNPTPSMDLSFPSPSFLSALAAQDAALRIATDLIGATLADADELTRGTGMVHYLSDSGLNLIGEQTYSSNPDQSNSVVGVEDQPNHLQQQQQQSQQQSPDMTHQQQPQPQQPSQRVLGSITATSRSRPRSLASSHSNSIQDLMLSATEDLLDTTQQVIETNQHTIDLFEQALNDFQALTMRNFADSSDEDDDDNEGHDRDRDDLNAGVEVDRSEASEPHDGHNGSSNF